MARLYGYVCVSFLDPCKVADSILSDNVCLSSCPWCGDSITSMRTAHSAHMRFEHGLSMTIRYQGKLRFLRGGMDYALWYGNPYDMEANFLVVEVKPRGDAGAALHSW